MKRNVLKATALVFVLSLIAKVIGFLKSVIQASYFGTNIKTDAFNVASGFVSNVLYMLATAIAVAFVPIYIQRKTKRQEKEFATRTITTLALCSVLLTVLLILIAPFVVKIIAPSYRGVEFETTVKYFRVLMLGFAFAMTTHLYSNLLNAEKVYGFSTFCSIINSIVLIGLIVLFAGQLDVWVLVISMPVSYFIQGLFLYIRGRQYASFSIKYGLFDNSLKVLAIQALPILISQATVEINQVVDRALLTSVGEGALTAVSYSAVLYQFITTLVSTPLSTVMFTELSEAGADHDEQRMKSILKSCYKILILLCAPILLIMFFLPDDIVNIVYGHGRFTAEAVANCAIGLKMYGLCLLPVCIKTVLSRAYYAANNTRRPMVIGVFEVILNIGLSVLLVKDYGIVGVVGATAISSLVFIIAMLFDYNIKYIKVLTKKDILSYWKIVLAAIVIIVLMIVSAPVYFYSPIVNFIVKSLLVFCIYFGLLALMREATFYAFITHGRRVIRQKIGRNSRTTNLK